MAHRTLKSGYRQLTERLNRFPQGAPPSELLFKILAVLMDEREAELLSKLPIKPFTAAKAARAWGLKTDEAGRILDELAHRALLVDIKRKDKTIYVLPPPMAGFFEFSMMRTRGDIDQKLLSELFHQYTHVESDFALALMGTGQTQLGRALVQEPALPADAALHVLDYERASEVIKTARHIGVGLCYCRHKMQHLGRACEAPLDICMSFGTSADSLIRHGHVRRIDAAECLDLLDQAYDMSLVQFGENVQNGVSFICNCCGCCCEAMIAARKFGHLQPVHTSNFLPELNETACTGCGLCVAACPVEALSLVSANDPQRPARKRAVLAEEICLGCGVCVRACTQQAIKLQPRAERVITPVTSAHRYVLMAIERGKLQNFIFDNQILASHRALAAVLGAILKLPPLKRALASRQLHSRYLESLFRRAPI